MLGIGSTVTTTPTDAAGDRDRRSEETSTGNAAADTGTDHATDTGAGPGRRRPRCLRTGNLSGYCEPATQRQLVAAITGRVSVDRGRSRVCGPTLPVLPLIQPSSVFAVSDALRSVVDGPHDGWAWTGR